MKLSDEMVDGFVVKAGLRRGRAQHDDVAFRAAFEHQSIAQIAALWLI
jgi:hypothetical protein